MNIFSDFRGRLVALLEAHVADGTLPAGTTFDAITAEPPRDADHGDIATNAALVLARTIGMKPRDFAERLAVKIKDFPDVDAVDIAGPGFINVRLSVAAWHAVLRNLLQQGTEFGTSTYGNGKKVNIEYVSANPTGPMHVGHARGACVGDALSNLLKKVGYDVTREYYINDAGAQVDHLADALYARYLVVCGRLTPAEFDDMLATKAVQYGGAYVLDAAQALHQRDGERWVACERCDWLPHLRQFGIDWMMALIRDDLAALGVHPDVFSSEKAIVAAKRVEAVEQTLSDRGLLYTGVLEPPKGKIPEDWEPRPQTLFRSTDYGDDIDRPLKKNDGSWTYFAADIAYHFDKYQRGFHTMIDVFGADHGGYVKRMQAAVTALSEGHAQLDIKLCQMVSLMDGGQPVKMSKRAGTFVTLRDVVDRVGKDVVRFMMLSRKNDVTLDFDYTKVTEQSKDNPVFYVQYAHARGHSVKRHSANIFPKRDLTPQSLATVDLSVLSDPDEMALVRLLCGWPRFVEAAAMAYEPHRIVYFLGDVAAAFHALWNKGREQTQLRFLDPEQPDISVARLALVESVLTVLASGLAILGVDPVEEM